MPLNSTMNFTSPPEPAKVIDVLSKLSRENPAVMKQAMEETGKMIKRANASTREEMIENHMEQVHNLRMSSTQVAGRSRALNITHSWNTKPSNPSSGSRHELCPMAIADLTLQTTHKGRNLRGTLVVPPYTMIGISSILEDEAGDMVRVAFYNMMPPNIPQEERQARGEALLPKGTMVAVSEPFYKIAADGGPLVRVDNPHDVEMLEALSPATAEGWKQEGNRFFRSTLFQDASECYSRALAALCEQTAILPLLLNISNTFFRLEDFSSSLLFAIVARSVSNGGVSPAANATHAKAQYRLGLAMASSCAHLRDNEHAPVRLFSGAALWFKHESKGLGMDDVSLERVVSSLAGSSRKLMTEEPSGSMQDFVELLSSLPCATAIEAPLSSGANAAKDANDMQRMTPAQLKEEGNMLFRQDKLREALSVYAEALQAELHGAGGKQDGLATLLCNRSLCHCRLGDHSSAYFDATAAMALDPARVKAHFRRCSALVELGLGGAAQAACDLAMETCRALDSAPSTLESLAELEARIAILRTEPCAEIKETALTGGLRDSEREFKQIKEEASLSLEQIAGLNQLLSLLPDEAGGLLALDSRIPDFHTEFATHGMWPQNGQVQRYSRVLKKAFEQARALPLMELQFRELPKCMPRPPTWEFDIAKRLGEVSPESVEWFRHAPVGSVRAHHPEAGGYPVEMQHSFSNAPHLPLQLRFGSCHVAVGFVDLGTLLFCDLVDPITFERWDGSSPCERVEWVGYEQSPYSVAKTLVVLDMLSAGDVEVDSILQVWFSSSWSTDTADAFRRAVSRVMQSHTQLLEQGASVRRILKHWLQHQVALEAARRLWLDAHPDAGSEAASCRLLADRLALTRYELCGELPGLAQAVVGSSVMFGLPEDSGYMALGESIFHFIPLEPLVLYRTGTRASKCRGDAVPGLPGYNPSDAHPAPDIVTAAVELLRDGVSHVARAVRMGRLQITVRLGRVGGDDEELLAEIKRTKPRTMTWSNVADYWRSGEMMEVLEQCSVAGTEHILYSMNWAMRVKGAFAIDIQDLSATRHALEQGKQLLGARWTSGDERMLNTKDHDPRPDTTAQLLLCPPPTNPYNVTDWYIAHCNVNRVCSRFLQYIVSAAAARGQDIAGDEPMRPRRPVPQSGAGPTTLAGPFLLSNPFRSGLRVGVSSSPHASEDSAGVDGWTAFTFSPFHRTHTMLAFSFRAASGS